MKFITAVYIVILLVPFTSCKKGDSRTNDVPVDSTYFEPSAFRLKSFAMARISDSDYSFDYDPGGRLTSFKHASGLYLYKCLYKGKALVKIINQNPLTSADTIDYIYHNGLLSRIDIIPQNQSVSEKLELFYDELKRVTHINWLLVENKKWFINRRLAFSYYSGNNIRTFKNYYFNGSAVALFDATSYQLYDNMVNPKTNFFISGTLNDHFVYLPYVKLQINNTIKESLLRGTHTFRTEHNYTYFSRLPVSDNKTIYVIPNHGIPYSFQTNDLYDYY